MNDDRRRELPPVHALVSDALVARYGASYVTRGARVVIDRARSQDTGRSHSEIADDLERWLARTVGRAINATGVVIHTNLGRAPWRERALQRAVAAAGYSTVEIDPGSGKRGRRGESVHERLCALTGAQAALVTNNCAAALVLCLRQLARGRSVLIGRSDLVEIGGGFRIPEILEESGARLVEVGTTNRTHLRDFEEAIDADVGAILQVHHSNFRQVGFVARPSLDQLATLGPPVLADLGSGAVRPCADEPLVQQALKAGAALVCFSGDKLLGGPQAGIVVGTRAWVDRLARQPLMRALRPDKVTLAALEGTLDDWLCGVDVPVSRMIDADLPRLRAAVDAWLGALPETVQAEAVEVEAAVGGGSLPGRTWRSVALAVRRPEPKELAAALLQGTPPVIGRLHGGALLLDARTVVPLGESQALLEALLSALARLP